MFSQDVDDATVAELAKDLYPKSFGAFLSTTTYAAWRRISITFVLCLGDKPSTVVAAQYLVDTAEASGNHMIDKVVEYDIGHSPFISNTEWLAATLVEESGREV